ncbi:MAG: hypothetical protein LBK60_03105 [Verrucomicrobiales bacterium]|jgi:chromosome segregation ATPase|nr:hypothetical protein [Verrucomicrobiales bacterium]
MNLEFSDELLDRLDTAQSALAEAVEEVRRWTGQYALVGLEVRKSAAAGTVSAEWKIYVAQHERIHWGAGLNEVLYKINTCDRLKNRKLRAAELRAQAEQLEQGIADEERAIATADREGL